MVKWVPAKNHWRREEGERRRRKTAESVPSPCSLLLSPAV
jgi:hypothetical protein